MNNKLDKFMHVYGRWFGAISGLALGIALPDSIITAFFGAFLIYLTAKKFNPNISLSYFSKWRELKRIRRAMRR